MTTWTMQDYTPEEDEAFKKLTEEQQQQEEEQPRSFWNLRIVRMPQDKWGGDWFEVQEVYYNNEGKPCGYCNSFVGGENMDELNEQIERHKQALALPILDSETDFNNKWNDGENHEFT